VTSSDAVDATADRGQAETVLEDTVRELMPDLLAYFRRRLVDSDDAADAVSETLVVMWTRRSVLPTDAESIRRYSFGIAHNVLRATERGRLRRHGLTERLKTELALHPPIPVEPDLRAALGELSKSDRELILLVAWDGFSIVDAARVLGIRAGAARTRYSRARARLRGLIQRATPDDN
jgi:RNA polymerase sigma-70 factor (ECF subfamily)